MCLGYLVNLKLTTSNNTQGIGHALNVSREIATFCTKDTGLIPQLYVVSPLRCTAESALLAFPHYAPGNIHNKPWICHDKCVDTSFDKNSVHREVQELKDTFPGVDYNLMRETSSDSFLSWLKRRNEKVVVGEYYLVLKQIFFLFAVLYS